MISYFILSEDDFEIHNITTSQSFRLVVISNLRFHVVIFRNMFCPILFKVDGWLWFTVIS